MMKKQNTLFLFLGLIGSLFFTGCSDYDLFSVNEANNAIDDVEDRSYENLYNSLLSSSSRTSIRSSSSYYYDYYYDYYSSSSKKEEVDEYLYKSFTLNIDLTYFKQVSDNWEDLSSHNGNYSDGDPEVHFIVMTYSNDNLVDSVVTDKFKVGEDVGTWMGSHLYTKNLSGGINEIQICPVVYERNIIELNVNHSSMRCYGIMRPSTLLNQWISQNDYYATDHLLKWRVQFYYN